YYYFSGGETIRSNGVGVFTVMGSGDVLIGDVNGDGDINVQDVTALISYILGSTPPNFVIENANVNDSSDGVIDIQDVTALINLILE
ncbi:MAG: dockerin type I repeat-containing protein, partial [Muribaculaceae bacterium]|nr:dockerin type I repeat-containing protein [Muribaculaceae bacterium]